MGSDQVGSDPKGTGDARSDQRSSGQAGADNAKPGTGSGRPRSPEGSAEPDVTGAGKPRPESGSRGASDVQSPEKGEAPESLPRELPSAEAIQRLAERLKDMQKPGQDAQRDQQAARKMRERAQKLWDQASPEQQKQWEDLARQWAKRMGEQDAADSPPSTSPRPESPRTPRSPAPTRADSASNPSAAGERATTPTGSHGPSPSAGADAPGGDGPGRADRASGGAGGTPFGERRGTQQGPGDRAAAEWRSEPVDAREHASDDARRPAEEQVIAEWFTPPRVRPAASGAPDAGGAESADSSMEEGGLPAPVAERLEQAAEQARRAVEDGAVSSRYERLLRKYFERLPQRVREHRAGGAPAGAPDAAPPAKDAR